MWQRLEVPDGRKEILSEDFWARLHDGNRAHRLLTASKSVLVASPWKEPKKKRACRNRRTDW
jgi:hypothetical protein